MDPRIMQCNPWLVVTNAAFILPYIYAARRGALLLAFSSLAVASVGCLYHATKDPILFWIDQAAVMGMAAATLVHGYRGGTIHISCSFIAGCILLYYVGWFCTSLVWSHSYAVATTSHAFMHVWVIIGIYVLLNAR